MAVADRRGAGLVRRRAFFAASLVGIIGIAFAVFLATRDPASGVNIDTALVGKPAPPIAGASIVGGPAFDLAAERGHYVFVDFFASWCSACIDEAPNLAAFLFSHRHDREMTFVGVDIQDSPGSGASFLRRTGANWPAIEDPNGPNSIALAYGIAGPPQIWLIDPQGLVVGRLSGNPTASQLNTLFAAAKRDSA